MTTISQLKTLPTPLQGDELVEIVKSGKNYKVTANALIGKTGLSAYEIAVKEGGFKGSLSDWLESLKGIRGTRWFIGDVLPDVNIGLAGDYYINRSTGRFYGKQPQGTWFGYGRLFVPGDSVSEAFVDAPDDGRTYVREHGNWVPQDNYTVTELLAGKTIPGKNLSPETITDLMKMMGIVYDSVEGSFFLDQGNITK